MALPKSKSHPKGPGPKNTSHIEHECAPVSSLVTPRGTQVPGTDRLSSSNPAHTDSQDAHSRSQAALSPRTAQAYFRPNAYFQIPARARWPSRRRPGQGRAIELGKDPPDGAEGCPRLRSAYGEARSRLGTPRTIGACSPGCRLRGCGLPGTPLPSFRTLVGARSSNQGGFWFYRDVAGGGSTVGKRHVLVPREDQRHRRIALPAGAVPQPVQTPPPRMSCWMHEIYRIAPEFVDAGLGRTLGLPSRGRGTGRAPRRPRSVISEPDPSSKCAQLLPHDVRQT